MAVVQVDPNNFTLQVYDSQDENLISSTDIDTVLTGSSYIEFFIYENNSTLAFQNYSYINYSVENDSPSTGLNAISQFNINPESDCQTQGFDRGDNIAYYNFLNKQIGNVNQKLFISEISSDRTEIRLDSNVLSDIDIVEQTNKFTQKREDSDYFLDFYLNFGNNDLLISNNIRLDNENTVDPTILVKLYEPLPPEFNLKSELWVVTTLNEPEAFRVSFPNQVIDFDDTIQLQGPNLNLPIKGQINNSTQNLSYTDLIASNTTSSFQQLKSLIASSSLQISIDYSDFDDFIHFSSAKTRLENFNYKVGLIQGYSASISDLTSISSSATSVNILEDKIGRVKQNFDGFEYYLYYSSGSTTWPKTTSIQPYTLATTGSTDVLTWLGSDNEGSAYYGGQILSASNFDNQNPDNLLFSIPEYLREDAANEPYDLFVSMVGQNFDDIWVYTKDITQKYNADNRLDYGVSKDLVADAIRDFGIKLYQNNFSKDDLYTAFLGMTPNGALFPFPDITGSLPVPTGYEYVNTMISASTTPMPLDDVNKSIYKRIYHNLPYLIQSKGTIPGLRALITSYGIPDTILKISEFGGKDKVNTNDWDYYFNKFNYAFDTNGDNFITTDWIINFSQFTGEIGRNPRTVQFRFKAEDIPPINYSQSLWTMGSSTVSSSIVLEYSGSGLISGSYSASIKDPYYQYGTLKYINGSGQSASAYLPFFNGGWWSVMATVDSSTTASLHVGNKIYNGKDGTSIGYYSSSAVAADGWELLHSSTSSFGKPYTGYSNFSGSFQEIRYFAPYISESAFKDYIMNPLSIEANSPTSSADKLVFRAGLGSELNISTALTQSSIHPKITGSWYNALGAPVTSIDSFIGNSNYNFNTPPSYSANTEYYFLDQPAVGIKNRITDKVRFENNVVPAGSTLSPFRRVTQQTEASASYTPHINLLEVAFSPQNEINDDIIGQLGYFNVGDYIGDPRQRSSSLDYYPDLNVIRDDYFKKYIKNYDLVDFIRLIKFFDNSLFRMIKDFIPARTSLASGLVIKQHLLERNKYPQPQLDINTEIAKYPKSGSIIYNEPIIEQDLELLGTVAPQWNDYNSGSIANLTGGAGGNVNKFNLPPIPMQFKYNVIDKIGDLRLTSTIRGVIENLNFNASEIGAGVYLTGSVFELYDGENLYVEFKNKTSGTNTIAWSTSDGIPSQYGLTVSGVTFPAEFNIPFTGSTPTTLGKDTRWQNTSSYFSINYLPKETLYKTDTNIQRWQYANSTLSGSITQTQDSQDEFYNGEYSGSTIIATTGELNSGCDVFKNVSTTAINYAVRYYSEDDYSKSDWLDRNNRPLDGFISIFRTTLLRDSGIKFIKIAKIDGDGNDQSNLLPYLTQIKIVDENNNPIYTILNNGDEANYVFYNVITATNNPVIPASNPLFLITGSTSMGVGNYMQGLFTQSFDSTTDNSTIPNLLYTPDDERIFKGNYFNPIGMNFTLPTYFQKDFIVSMSADITASNTDTSVSQSLFTFYRSDDNNAQILTATQSLADSVYTASISASFIVSASIFTPGISIGFTLGAFSNSTPFITASINNFVLTLRTSGSVGQAYYENVFEPNFGDNNWARSLDCHAILNNAQDNRLNPFLQDVDYNTGQIVPTNITAIISESATKAAIPESNYTALKVINPRYLGSKNQSEKVNQWTPSGSWGNNIGTYGKTPSIDSLSNTIYEFDFINAAAYPNQDTTPYLPNIGTIHMRKIYEVATSDSVKTVNPLESSRIYHTTRPTQFTGSKMPYTSDYGNFSFSSSYNNVTQSVNNFYYTINNDLTTNTPIQITQYSPTVNASSPIETKVLATGFSKTKGRNAYIITSSLTAGTEGGQIRPDSNAILFYNGEQKLYLNSNVGASGDSEYGDYTQGPFSNTLNELFTNGTGSDAYGNESSIKTSLENGNRWFITLFQGPFGPSINPNDITPYNHGFTGVDEDGNLTHPLQYHGVHEILSVESGSNIGLITGTKLGMVIVTDTMFTNWASIGGSLGGLPAIGAIIWKAELNPGLVLTQDNIFKVDKGAFTTKYPIPDITNNFDQITRDFGANQT